FPDRSLAPSHGFVVERRVSLVALNEHESDDCIRHLFTKHAREPITGGSWRREPVPIPFDDLAQANTWLVGDGLQRLEQQRSPAGQELCACVQLNIQKICRGEVVRTREPLTDDVGARSYLVVPV